MFSETGVHHYGEALPGSFGVLDSWSPLPLSHAEVTSVRTYMPPPDLTLILAGSVWIFSRFWAGMHPWIPWSVERSLHFVLPTWQNMSQHTLFGSPWPKKNLWPGACGSSTSRSPIEWNFKPEIYPRWWFQILFVFTPIWGRFPFWLIFFRGGWNHQPVYLFLSRKTCWLFFLQDFVCCGCF